ncbi:MAG: DNA-binding response OmpR family regulator [Cyclobacteriaceae bacterium]|jgi:DNA-binding response OmpR family regulator
MAKLLIVDDEPHMRLGLKDNLEFESFEVEMAMDGAEALVKTQQQQFDLILLDVMMPKMSGLEVCKTMRKEGVKTPIIFLTAKSEEIDKVLGLEIGGDDYITKPFSLRELVARVHAVLRRGTTDQPTTKQISNAQIGQLSIDFVHYTASANGIEEKMTHKEFEILRYLLQHSNEVVSRHQLLEDVWGYQSQPTTRTVDNFILKLRQRIEANPNDPQHILTVHGIGYKLLT